VTVPSQHASYITGFFFDKRNDKTVFVYKIEATRSVHYPFRLFKRSSSSPLLWKNLSFYASLHDVVRVLLKELLPEDLADQVYHGQASVDTKVIVDKLERGERSISIFNTIDNDLYKAGDDVNFEEMISRK